MELLTVVEKRNRVMRWRSLMLDLDQRCLRVGTSVVAASRAEFALLHLLISRRNLPMSKDAIMAGLFGADHGRDLRQVDMFVARLRQSLSQFGLAGLISTVGGRGYAVIDEGEAVAAREAQPVGGIAAMAAC